MVQLNLFSICLFESLLIFVNGNKNLLHQNYNNFEFANNTDNLNKIFELIFHRQYSLQVVEDKSYSASKIIKVLHNLSSLPSLYLGMTNGSVNYDRIYVSSNLTEFINLLREHPPIAKNKFISIITDSFNENILQQLIDQGIENIMNSSNGLIVDIKIPNIVYKYNPLQRTFKSLEVSEFKHDGIINYGNIGKTKLKVGTYNCSIDSQIGPLDNSGEPSWFDGVEMTFFHTIAKKLNFSYEIIFPVDLEGIGSVDKDGKFSGGLMEMLGEKKIDIAFCGIWKTEFRSRSSLALTSPISEVCLTYLIKRPLPFSQKGLGLFNSFSWEVWLTMWGLLLFVTLFINFLTMISANILKLHYNFTRFMRFDQILFSLWEILCNNAPKSFFILGPLRHVFLWWSVLALLLSTSFSSSLIAHLTRTLYEKPCESFQDLIENEYIWCSKATPMFETLFNLDNPWQKIWVDRNRIASEDLQCELIERGYKNIAILAIAYTDGILTDDHLSCKHVLDHYQSMSNCVTKFKTAFFLQSDSPYTDVFSEFITRYHESGIFIKLYRDMFFKIKFKDHYVHELGIPHSKKKIDRMKLKLTNTILVFLIHLSGLFLGFVIFIFELLWYNRTSVLNYLNRCVMPNIQLQH